METILYEDDIPEELIRPGDIAIDTETTGLNLGRDKLCLLQLSYGKGDATLVKFNNNYTAKNLKKLIFDKTRLKIFHFARFDIAMIKKHLGEDVENIFCTKIASRLVRTYTDSHGLKEICKELLGVQISKAQQSTYWAADTLSKEQLDYAASDVLYLHDLKKRLEYMLIRENRDEIASKIFNFLPVRANLDLQGWENLDIFAH
ncbi:MAG: ribonuclease H-like domain-containing protein [Rickettsiaceae bacterium]|nr:ribonuclease H-like domain-containing protein [Rickettsiaceae bacterium]